MQLGSISAALSGPRESGGGGEGNAGSFPETAAGNRAYEDPGMKTCTL